MKSSNRRWVFWHCASALAVCAAYSTPVLAQDAPTPQAAPQKTHPIRVRNVEPSMMAWWLDPKHHPEPSQFRNSRSNRESNPLIVEKENPKLEIPALPAGIDRIVAINPQNALLVSGTDESIAALEKIVAQLDQPLRQVEVEFQVLEINPKDARQLGVASSSDPKKRYLTVPLSAGALTRLAELKAANKESPQQATGYLNGKSVTFVVKTQRAPTAAGVRSDKRLFPAFSRSQQ